MRVDTRPWQGQTEPDGGQRLTMLLLAGDVLAVRTDSSSFSPLRCAFLWEDERSSASPGTCALGRDSKVAFVRVVDRRGLGDLLPYLVPGAILSRLESVGWHFVTRLLAEELGEKT
jgi:hypothetical protein